LKPVPSDSSSAAPYYAASLKASAVYTLEGTVIGRARFCERFLAAMATENFHYSARPLGSMLLTHSNESPGLHEYPLPGLGMIKGMAMVFDQGNGLRIKQLIVPVPADWEQLHKALMKIDGVKEATLGAEGVITITRRDGRKIRGMMDYLVTHDPAETDAVTSIKEVGDVSGNGFKDYLITYSNGHRQLLYVMPAE